MSDYSETLMEHFQEPHNRGRIEDADCVGVAGRPGQGRFVVIYLRLRDGKVHDAHFECYGCGVTVACGSVITELAEGKTVAECQAISREDVVEALDGVPHGKRDAVTMAIHALKNACNEGSGA